jgi:hypothetical protein
MSTRFIQVLPNYGVDDTGVPIPEMIVPLRGTNHILLIDGEGLDVKAETPNMLEITEVKNFVRRDLLKPRMFRLKGKMLPGKVGMLVVARRGSLVVARLRVFVSRIGSSDWLSARYKQLQGFSMRKFFRIQSLLSIK